MLKKEFSWSLSRCRLFYSCKKAYFYRYHASWEGWDDFAPDEAKEVHILKNLRKIDLWIEDIFVSSIREVFLHTRSSPKDFNLRSVSHRAAKRIHLGWDEFINSHWKKDHKSLNLFEFYYNTQGIDRNAYPDDAVELVNLYLAKFAKNKVFSEIAHIPYICVRDFRFPDYFMISGIKAWTSPGLIWLAEDGNLNVLNFGFEDPVKQNSWAERMAVSAIFAENKFRIPEERQNCRTVFLLKTAADIFSVYAYSNLCEMRKRIVDSSAEMSEFENSNNEISGYPASPNPEKCLNCEFRKVCTDGQGILEST